MRAGNIELSLCAAAGAAAAGLAWSKYERGHFVTEELVFSSSKIKEPAILVFLSDLHDNTFGEKNEKLLKEIKRIHPDAVLIGGDTMVTKFPAVSCHSDEKTKGDFSSFCQNDGFLCTGSRNIIWYSGRILNM